MDGWVECDQDDKRTLLSGEGDMERAFQKHYGVPFSEEKMREQAIAWRKAWLLGREVSVDDGIWEALQRLIENGAMMGPASREDALVVARWRSFFKRK